MLNATAMSEASLVIAVLEIVWKNTILKAAVYALGCVRPEAHGLSWRIIYTSMKHQIMSLSRETREFRNLWAPGPMDSHLPTRYKDVYGLLELYRPNARRWVCSKDGIRFCPFCGAPWPLFRWVWAHAGVDHNAEYPRTVTFCAVECPQALYCPSIPVVRGYLRNTRAPAWIAKEYQGSGIW